VSGSQNHSGNAAALSANTNSSSVATAGNAAGSGGPPSPEAATMRARSAKFSVPIIP